MKLQQTIIKKIFHVKIKDKIYFINYLNTDGQVLQNMNRDNWEIFDEEGEELQLFYFKEMSKELKIEVDRNNKLAENIINFCIKHFNDYNPNT